MNVDLRVTVRNLRKTFLSVLSVASLVFGLVLAPSVSAVDSYDVNAWSSTTVLPTAVYGNRSVAYNGYVYALGGTVSGVGPSTTAVYAPLNANGTVGSWQSTTSLPTGVYNAMTVAHNGYIYHMGGDPTGGSSIATVYYAPLNANGTIGTWQSTTSLPTGVRHGATAVYNGYVYVVGNDGLSNSVYYAPLNGNGTVGTWQSATNYPINSGYASAVTYNGRLYVFGGLSSNGGPSFAESAVRYATINSNGSLGSWQTAANSLPYTVYNAGAVVHNGYVYVVAGIGGATHDTVVYAPLLSDGTVGSWQTSSQELPTWLDNAGTTYYNGHIYAIGGSNSGMGNTLNSVYYSNIQATSSVNLTNAVTGGDLTLATPDTTNITCSSSVTEASLSTQDSGYDYPLGLLNFCMDTDFSNNQVTVTVATSLSPFQVMIRHYNATSQQYTTVSGATVTATTLNGQPALRFSYNVSDNGTLDTNSAVGAITDPVGIAVAPSNSTTTSSSGGLAAPDTGLPPAFLGNLGAAIVCAGGITLLAAGFWVRRHRATV